jgi:hypothetical protein
MESWLHSSDFILFLSLQISVEQAVYSYIPCFLGVFFARMRLESRDTAGLRGYPRYTND